MIAHLYEFPKRYIDSEKLCGFPCLTSIELHYQNFLYRLF